MSAHGPSEHGGHHKEGGGNAFGNTLFGDVIGGGAKAMVHGILFPWENFGGGGGGGHDSHGHH